MDSFIILSRYIRLYYVYLKQFNYICVNSFQTYTLMLMKEQELKPKLRDLMKDFAMNVLLAMSDPDPSRVIKKKFMSGIIPENWEEKVYEFDNQYLVEVSAGKLVQRDVELSVWAIIKKEFGTNVISMMAENTPQNSLIKVQLKKDNYSDDNPYGMAI